MKNMKVFYILYQQHFTQTHKNTYTYPQIHKHIHAYIYLYQEILILNHIHLLKVFLDLNILDLF